MTIDVKYTTPGAGVLWHQHPSPGATGQQLGAVRRSVPAHPLARAVAAPAPRRCAGPAWAPPSALRAGRGRWRAAAGGSVVAPRRSPPPPPLRRRAREGPLRRSRARGGGGGRGPGEPGPRRAAPRLCLQPPEPRRQATGTGAVGPPGAGPAGHAAEEAPGRAPHRGTEAARRGGGRPAVARAQGRRGGRCVRGGRRPAGPTCIVGRPGPGGGAAAAGACGAAARGRAGPRRPCPGPTGARRAPAPSPRPAAAGAGRDRPSPAGQTGLGGGAASPGLAGGLGSGEAPGWYRLLGELGVSVPFWGCGVSVRLCVKAGGGLKGKGTEPSLRSAGAAAPVIPKFLKCRPRVTT